jgi:hypothetical protein
MYIKKFQIGNYKGFLKTDAIELGPGLNIICGANNAGKTAVLETLGPSVQANPHRSPQTIPAPGAQPDPGSWIEVFFSVSREELRQMMREQPVGQYRLAAPDPGGPFGTSLNYARNNVSSARRLVETVLGQNELTFHLRRNFGLNRWDAADFPSFGLYSRDPGIQPSGFVVFTMGADGLPNSFSFGQDTTNVDLGVQLVPSIASRIYRFTAERMNIGVCPFGNDPNLSPNASDLPRVLSILQANPFRFATFNRLLNEILPQVKHVSVHPFSGGQNVEIRVWPFDPASEREDLALALAQCGTGVGQVMAILYVVLYASKPQVILIDEPQSFLHPGAARKLIEVLKNHSKHQFIIATHSPAIISAAEPTTITVAKTKDGEGSLDPINPSDAKSLQVYLAEVGARLSDVFGADSILWVEGSTEELCFPLILEKIAKTRLRGTCILSVSSTGDLQGRDANRVFDMYNRLSNRHSLLPPAVGFIFDDECRSDELKRELAYRSHDLLTFLPRRMYENYLLNSEAIAAVCRNIEGFRPTAVLAAEVQGLIEQMRADPRYFRPAEIDPLHWQRDINAAMVLEQIFTQLSDTRVRFDKVRDSVRLTEWLIANAPQELQEIANFISDRVKPNPTQPIRQNDYRVPRGVNPRRFSKRVSAPVEVCTVSRSSAPKLYRRGVNRSDRTTD